MILLEKSGPLAKVVLNRPDARNSINLEMAKELRRCLDECKADEEITTILLTGSGKDFCLGLDLSELASGAFPSLTTWLDDHLHPIVECMYNMDKIVLCAVNGRAKDAGVALALASDLTIASLHAVFVMGYSQLGLIPDGGNTYFLPRLIGRQRAIAMMLLNEEITAKEAVSLGMIYSAVKDRGFEKAAMALAQRIAGMPKSAMVLTKKALCNSFYNDLDKQLAIEEHLQTTAGETPDFRAGLQSILDKGSPGT